MYRWDTLVLLKHLLDQGLSKSAIAPEAGVSRGLIYHLLRTGELERELSAPRPERSRHREGRRVVSEDWAVPDQEPARETAFPAKPSFAFRVRRMTVGVPLHISSARNGSRRTKRRPAKSLACLRRLESWQSLWSVFARVSGMT